jgi:hypothetical protein
MQHNAMVFFFNTMTFKSAELSDGIGLILVVNGFFIKA